MNEEKHVFRVNSAWTGYSDGDGTLTAEDGRKLDYGRPPEMGGAPGRTNPEEMLLGAVASCYSMTLAILAERRRLPVTRIDVAAEAEVIQEPGGTLKYTAIHLHPRITLTGDDEAQKKAVLDFAQKAEVYCVISRAVRGNVEITVSPEIVGA
ncbi:MAG TPA: OsmC family protein [Chthonomonadaceae bacterium]|nr:OsmC family protein [Chthonomonadaceae bacterium]